MIKQVIFLDNARTVHAGISLDDGGVICGCCGCYIKPNKHTILYTYSNWLNIEEEICGDGGIMFHKIEEKVDRLTTSEIETILDGKKDFNA